MLHVWKALCAMMHVVCSAMFWIMGLVLLNAIANKEKNLWFHVAFVCVCAAIVVATSKSLGEGVYHLIAFPLILLGFVRY